MSPPIDPYKTLQVDPEAEEQVIVAAYRRLARKYHPDVAPGDEARTRMTAINAAWELIGDPAKRASFDRERAVRAAMDRSTRPATPTSPAAPAAPRPASQPDRSTPPPPRAGPVSPPPTRPPETVSRDWTSGRSSVGGGYDPSMRTADGSGAAGPPPGVRPGAA